MAKRTKRAHDKDIKMNRPGWRNNKKKKLWEQTGGK